MNSPAVNSQYQPISTLQGPRDAVVSLAFSVKAKFLSAAGNGLHMSLHPLFLTRNKSGYSGVCVWDLSTFSTTPLPHMLFAPQNPKYVITTSVWVYFQKNKRHVLLLGSMRGDIILWDWNNETKVSLSYSDPYLSTEVVYLIVFPATLPGTSNGEQRR